MAESAERAAQADGVAKEAKAAQKKRQRKVQQSRLSFAEEEEEDGQNDAEKATDIVVWPAGASGPGPATAKQKVEHTAGPTTADPSRADAAVTPTAPTTCESRDA